MKLTCVIVRVLYFTLFVEGGNFCKVSFVAIFE